MCKMLVLTTNFLERLREEILEQWLSLGAILPQGFPYKIECFHYVDDLVQSDLPVVGLFCSYLSLLSYRFYVSSLSRFLISVISLSC